MAASATSLPLKYRIVQPVDIERCYQLETTAYPPEDQASKSVLQHRQHHAAAFFRCVLLKKQSEILDDGVFNGLSLSDSKEDDACHHVHHSNHNELIGYVCGTRCHDFAPAMELKTSQPQDRENNSSTGASNIYYPYPMKHEPTGPYLAIHSVVVQPEYRNQGVARAVLDNYIKSIETFNASADSTKPSITKRGSLIKDKVQKRPTKIEKLILVTKSHLLDFFISVGFRWRATISLGKSSVYELERDVTSSLPSLTPSSPVDALKSALPILLSQPNNTEQDCYLVDAFANPRRCGSGNAAAIVVLDGPPSRLIAERQTRIKDEDEGQWGVLNEQLNEILSHIAMDEEDEEELAEMRAEVWMHFVAREFHQPATGEHFTQIMYLVNILVALKTLCVCLFQPLFGRSSMYKTMSAMTCLTMNLINLMKCFLIDRSNDYLS
jgi:ribosomal protein S18 acetylase RimI-like enzyme